MSYYYKPGDIPIILLSLHGGGDNLDCKKRINVVNGKEHVVNNDSYTKKITLETYRHMMSKGLKPYILINNIHRKYIDLNRFINSACNDWCESCIIQHILFHDNLQKCVLDIIDKHGKCFIFDIHGNMHSKNMIQLGYGLNVSELKNTDLGNASLFSIKQKGITLKPYIYGNKSLSFYYKDLFTNVFPTIGKIDDTYIKQTNSKYYSGKQFIIKKYSDICDVVLVELSPELRKPDNIQKTSEKLTKGLIEFYQKVYSKL